jgi:acylphosphatase
MATGGGNAGPGFVAARFTTPAIVLNVARMKACRRFVVSGFVQGVFFRASAQDVACRLGLTGWVRNRPDGNVELLACGAPALLDDLESWLWHGPAAARVEHVDAIDAPVEEFADFRIAR